MRLGGPAPISSEYVPRCARSDWVRSHSNSMSAFAVRLHRHLLLVGLIFLIAGCGRISFISDRYDNFTAYYNTFYNAERSYREATDALDQTTEAIDRQVYLSVFPAPGRAINDQKFQAAIDKSADVLRDHPDSKWVDDALLLIGKSYYYQQNYPGAGQKFRETIQRGSALEDEARLWLARTLIGSGAYEEAHEHLIESLNQEDVSDRWKPSLRLAMGELQVRRGAFTEAVEELASGLADVRDNRSRARGWFLLGQVYETLGQYAEAAAAYEQVTRSHPRYELSYAAQLSAVRVKGMYVDEESALQEVRRMERDDKNYTNRYELAFIRGRIYQAQGHAHDARTLFQNILYDSDAQIGNVRGRIHYALGELYRDDFRDYEMAYAHFDTARSALQSQTSSGSGVTQSTPQYASEAVTDASDLADMFGSFAAVRGQISEMDSLLYLGSLDEEAFAARIFEIRTRLAEELAEQQRRAARMEATRGFQNAANTGPANQRQGAPQQNEATGSAGFLFHRDAVRVQEGRMNFIARWGERPYAPNWRRISAIEDARATADSAGELPPEQQLRGIDPSVGQDPLPPLDYSDVPRDSVEIAALRARRAAARYELANVLFLSMERPDSAAYWYRLVIEEDGDFPVAQRAFYALAEVHRSLGDSIAARRLYEDVLRDYPDSDFAGRVREQLGIREEVPSDTLAKAEELYDGAFQRWRRGSYREAINRMVDVAATYPQMEVAPRALIAAGHIYVELAERDSLDVFGPLPVHAPDSVLRRAGLLSEPETSAPEDSTWIDTASVQPDSSDAELLRDEAPVKDTDTGVSPESDLLRSADADAAKAADDDRLTVRSNADDALPNPPLGSSSVSADSTNALANEEGPTLQVRDGAGAQGAGTDGTDGSDASADTAAASDRSMNTDVTGEDGADDVGPSEFTDGTDLSEVSDDGGQTKISDSVDHSVTTNGTDPTEISIDEDVVEGGVVPSAGLTADSTRMDGMEADSTGAALFREARKHSVHLETLYTSVKENYPRTSYAELADQLLLALRERRDHLQALADSAAAAAAQAADSAALAADSTALAVDSTALIADSTTLIADSTALAANSTTLIADDIPVQDSAAVGVIDVPASDSTATGPDGVRDADRDTVSTGLANDLIIEAPSDSSGLTAPEVVDTASTGRALPAPGGVAPQAPASGQGMTSQFPAGDEMMHGAGGVDVAMGGFTLVLGTDTNEVPMVELAASYAEQGFRTDVLRADYGGRIVYRAVMGQFETRRDAGTMMQKYASQIEQPVRISPISELE